MQKVKVPVTLTLKTISITRLLFDLHPLDFIGRLRIEPYYFWGQYIKGQVQIPI